MAPKPGPCGTEPDKDCLQTEAQTLARIAAALRGPAGSLDEAINEGDVLRLLKSSKAKFRVAGLVAAGAKLRRGAVLRVIATIALSPKEIPRIRYLAIVLLGDAGSAGVSYLARIFLDSRTEKVHFTYATLNEHVSGEPAQKRSLQLWASLELTRSEAGRKKLHHIAIRPKSPVSWTLAILSLYDPLNGSDENYVQIATDALWETGNTDLLRLHAIQVLEVMFEQEHSYSSNTARSIYETLVSFSIAKGSVSKSLRNAAMKLTKKLEPLVKPL